jgi:hypothetical protein
MKNRIRLLAGLTLAFSSCAHDDLHDALKTDSAESYQQFLKAHPDAHGTEVAQARLAQLRFAEARKAHTALAYKRFLEDFPASEEAPDAAKLLEGLRYAAAEQRGTPEAFDDFLREHPEGAHATQAREVREKLAWIEATKGTGPEPLRRFLSRFPQSSHRTEAEQLMDDRGFAAAREQGNTALGAYLEHAPEGTHREEARALMQGQEAEALAQGGDLAAAYQVAQRVQGKPGEALQQRLAERELAEIAAALEPASLRSLATRKPRVADQALALVHELERDPRATKVLRAQVEKLDPLYFGRPIDELVRALDAPDPRDRWLAAEELGGLGAIQTMDRLLDLAADARFEEVRLRAFGALQQLAETLGPQAMEVEGRRRLEKLRKVASGPRLFLKVAMIEELAGLTLEAAADAQRTLRGDVEDLLPLVRLMVIDPSGFGRAVSARRLAVTLEEQARLHGSGDDGDPPLLAARWFCGALHEAQLAEATLLHLPPDVARDAPEDLATFTQRAQQTRALVQARLADHEDAARAENPRFVGCSVDDVAPRLEDGVHARLAAVEALAAAKSTLARYPLERTAHHDPSRVVRAAAQAALVASPLAHQGR